MARLAAAVLAGGRSTRWESEKAVARVGGAPMLARVAAVLARGCDTVSVNAPDASGAAAWARAHGLAVLPDPAGAPDGPLAGVLAGLEWAAAQGADVLVTAPCDTPHLPRDYVRRLSAGLRDAPAAMAVSADGAHPLCAAWSVSLLPGLRAELERGHPSVRAWLAAAGAAEVRFPHARALRNLNTRPESAWARAADAAALVLLLLLALVGVSALLFAFTFGDPMTEAARARQQMQAMLAYLGCGTLALLAVAGAVWLARRAGAPLRAPRRR